ncbi:uncharacterized protein K489DRAFT_384040 [Dissoconium aciculare CBS 342.82]|uniref:Tautomerase cis-CaaD-like domain-containing protein n=1 Tax=Dissoconium aciculare CBS 342.82 TaxID=1314786 RepID=A0A6J3LWX3_9PEZI|nr:uncharacterized protein K489DRAFT_384040 [Dissoconium aciculare CBS 342.82]KAF1819137.1 hypothetical protein K489DRAFT_384040 [Dissoconium aciculare CBS 342.82]
MPLWIVYHPSTTFQTEEEKGAFSKDVTQIYTSVGLPAFYVVVNFIKLEEGETWVGGEKRTAKPFIRLAIDHIAINLPNEDASYRRVTSKIDQTLKPHIEDKGYDWEYHVSETERRLWKVNGLIPPAHPSEEEKLWVERNRAVEYPGSKT